MPADLRLIETNELAVDESILTGESIQKEKDVVSIYPMAEIKDNNLIRILEIYKNQDAYKKHIASPHFRKYKEGTLHMVKYLDLVDTYQLSA